MNRHQRIIINLLGLTKVLQKIIRNQEIIMVVETLVRETMAVETQHQNRTVEDIAHEIREAMVVAVQHQDQVVVALAEAAVPLKFLAVQ